MVVLNSCDLIGLIDLNKDYHVMNGQNMGDCLLEGTVDEFDCRLGRDDLSMSISELSLSAESLTNAPYGNNVSLIVVIDHLNRAWVDLDDHSKGRLSLSDLEQVSYQNALGIGLIGLGVLVLSGKESSHSDLLVQLKAQDI